MRWQEETVKEPAEGDVRHKSGFLIFPMTIKGETRWLERVKWEEEYKNGLVIDLDAMGTCYGLEWRKTRWL